MADTVDVAGLFATHRLSLVRMAILLVDDRESAEDVVQDAFYALTRHAGRLRDPDAVLGYLRRSVMNGARSALRRRRTVRNHLKVAEPDVGPAADSPVLIAAEHAEVLAAVRTLPVGDQQVLALRYWSDLSDAQIADALDVAPGTVRSRASRAIARLKVAMEGSR